MQLCPLGLLLCSRLFKVWQDDLEGALLSSIYVHIFTHNLRDVGLTLIPYTHHQLTPVHLLTSLSKVMQNVKEEDRCTCPRT